MSTAAVIALAVILGVGVVGCGGGDKAAGKPTLATFTYEGIKLPRTKADGPNQTNPFPQGYAQTETGAALAAVNSTIVLDTASDSEWGQALAALVHHDEAYVQWATARQKVSIKPRSSSTAKVTITGYRVADYSPEKARVDVYSTYPDGSRARLRRTVRWDGGGWKLVLPGPDSKTPVIEAINDLPKDLVTL